MKIAKEKPYVLLEVINNLAVGGGQNVVCELVKNLDPQRYRVRVLCSGKKTYSQYEEQIEKICQVSYMGIDGHIGLHSMLSVMKEISKIKPDILHTHMGGTVFGLPWGILHNKPVVITAHTEANHAFSKKNELFVRYGLNHSKVVLVAVSEDNYHACKEYFNPPDKKCTYVNNGIDINKFYRNEHTGFAYINVACHEDYKNQMLALRCFEKISHQYTDTHFYFIGDGTQHNSLIEYTEKHGLKDRVTFTGKIKNPEDYLAISDAYVQPSHIEAMPMSVLEAMAAGLPIISTDVGGLKDVVKQNGILVSDGNEEDFLKAMLKIYTSTHDELDVMRKESQRMVGEYSSEKMAQNYMDIFDKLINKVK